MTNWTLKLLFLVLAASPTALATGYIPSNAYVHLPSATESQSHPSAMVALHNTVALVQFYEELLLKSEKFVNYAVQSQIYHRLLGELNPDHLQFSSTYAQRFVGKWKERVLQHKKSPIPMGIGRAEHLRVQLQEIEHYLKTDLVLLEAKRATPRGLKALANTRAVIEAAKEISAHYQIRQFDKMLSETVRKVTQPFMIGIIDEVIRTDRSAKNIHLVDTLTQTHPQDDLVHYDYTLRKLVESLRIQAEVKL